MLSDSRGAAAFAILPRPWDFDFEENLNGCEMLKKMTIGNRDASHRISKGGWTSKLEKASVPMASTSDWFKNNCVPLQHDFWVPPVDGFVQFAQAGQD